MKSLFAPLLACLFSACSLLPPIALEAPTVQLADIEVESFDGRSLGLKLDIDVFNPNARSIPLNDLSLSLQLLSVAVAKSQPLREPILIPANEYRRVALHFEMSVDRIAEVVRALGKRGYDAFDYELRGEARWGPAGWQIPVSKTGQIALLDHPMLRWLKLLPK